jgi:flavin reductase ActVB
MSDSPAISKDQYRQLVGSFAAGVTIVTTSDASGTPWGFTASSFTSVSLAPPLVLVCIAATADCFAAFSTATEMAIHVLAKGQGDLAMRFATKGADKFAGLTLGKGEHTRAPILPGALARIECRMHQRHVEGDHTILLGEVLGGARADAAPLLYYGRSFGRFEAEP